MDERRQPERSWVRALIVAGADPEDSEQVDLAIIRNVTFLGTGLAGAVFGTAMFYVHFTLVGVVGWIIATTCTSSYLLSRRGRGFWGAVLLVVVVNVTFVLMVAERGPGQLEVIHVFSISLPFTLFAFQQRTTLALSLALAIAGVVVAQQPLFPPPAAESLTHAHWARVLAISGVGVAIAAQLWGFFIVRGGSLERLREALAQAEHANEAKDAFLANISHEIRTPMNGVMGMLELLRDSSLEGAQQQQAEAAHAAALALLPTIDQLLHPDRIDPSRTSGSQDTLESGARRLSVAQRVLGALSGRELSASQQLAVEPATREGPPRVLVVDDNMINLKVTQRVLRRLECEVELASGGREALERIREGCFDLVLMDVQMPQMDGLEATVRIREQQLAASRERHLPIVALTAHAMAGDRERCLASGMDDYLSKPVKRAELEQLIARHVGRASAAGGA